MLISYELQSLDELESSNLAGNPIWQTSIPVKGFLRYGHTIVIGDARLSMFEHIEDSELPDEDEEYRDIIMPEALFHFASFCRKRGSYEVAITCLRMLLRIKPYYPEAQTNLGTTLAESGDFHQALAELEKALVLDPNDSIAHSGIGQVYDLLGNRSKALEHLTRAILLRTGDYPFAQKELDRIRSRRNVSDEADSDKASVFLSYASEDKAIVLTLADDLNKAGIDVWLDEWVIVPGDSIVDKINSAIKQNRYFLPIISATFLKKTWPMRELRSAIMKQANKGEKYIIPILIERCQLPDIISDIAYADLFTDYGVGLRKLLIALNTKEKKSMTR